MSKIDSANRALTFLLFIAAAVTLAGAGCVPANPEPQNNLQNSQSSANPAPETAVAMYKDGTYTSIGTYQSPAGPEEIGVTLTLKDQTVTDVSVEVKANVPISKNLQTVFSENVKPVVVGKKITDLKLTKISGASLTTDGFNNAIEKIKTQAGA